MKTTLWKRRSMAAGLALAGLLAAAAGAFAHEGHHHQAMGTVKAIHEEHLVLTIAEGKEQTFVVSAATTYLRGKEPATKGDVTPGDRAVVMYEKKDGADRAIEVKLGATKP